MLAPWVQIQCWCCWLLPDSLQRTSSKHLTSLELRIPQLPPQAWPSTKWPATCYSCDSKRSDGSDPWERRRSAASAKTLQQQALHIILAKKNRKCSCKESQDVMLIPLLLGSTKPMNHSCSRFAQPPLACPQQWRCCISSSFLPFWLANLIENSLLFLFAALSTVLINETKWDLEILFFKSSDESSYSLVTQNVLPADHTRLLVPLLRTFRTWLDSLCYTKIPKQVEFELAKWLPPTHKSYHFAYVWVVKHLFSPWNDLFFH